MRTFIKNVLIYSEILELVKVSGKVPIHCHIEVKLHFREMSKLNFEISFNLFVTSNVCVESITKPAEGDLDHHYFFMVLQ